MKTIIAGSRDGIHYEDIEDAVKASHFEITRVICGMARGADMHGKEWAKTNGIPVDKFPADWRIGRYAGFLRNQEMVDITDTLILVWDRKSKGAADTLKRAKKKGLKIYEHIPERFKTADANLLTFL